MIQRDERRKIDQLFREVADTGMSRRQMIQRAAVLGISAQALTIAFVSKAHQAVAQGDENPLGVDPEAPLDVVIFKGGYGDDYALNANEIYNRQFPNAEITYTGTQRLQEQFQARVVDGNPPDVMDNSGAGNFNTTSLFNEGQLADLTDLMEAPAFGQDGVTFADSLTAGTQDTGVFDGTQYYLNFVLSVWGVWFNQALLDENGWEYPQTWEDMLALCETIKTETDMAPWTYQGLYPQYMRAMYNQLVFKNGGWDAVLKLDNLAEDSWTQEPSILALQALQALYDNEYIMEGTEGLSHTESQTFWIQGDAVFLPCGAWLENEMKDVLEEYPDFQMTVAPVPNLTAEDPLPFETIESYSGEVFIVFSQGNNVQGGKEWLRLLFSQEGAQFFSEATRSLTVVAGAAEGLDLGSAFASVDAAIQAAGSNTFTTRYAGWYPDLDEESKLQIGMILTGETTAEEAAQAIQTLVDELRENPDIPKFTSEAPGASATPAS